MSRLDSQHGEAQGSGTVIDGNPEMVGWYMMRRSKAGEPPIWHIGFQILVDVEWEDVDSEGNKITRPVIMPIVKRICLLEDSVATFNGPMAAPVPGEIGPTLPHGKMPSVVCENCHRYWIGDVAGQGGLQLYGPDGKLLN